MRIVVVGTSGAGKTTLARRIAAQLQLPHIELNAINFVPGVMNIIPGIHYQTLDISNALFFVIKGKALSVSKA